MNEIKVLYIGGYSRSGSTILGQVLGEIDGFFGVGELRHIWVKGFLGQPLCGCGAPFRECDFWKAVAEEAFGGVNQVNWNEIAELWRQVDRLRYVPLLMSPWKTQAYRERLQKYCEILGRLYKAVQSVSGDRVIIDSSKYPSSAYILNALPNVKLYVVHLVRDSRAVAYSWLRKKVEHRIQGETVYMGPQSSGASAAWWLLYNLSMETLKRSVSKYALIRYEDFIDNPKEVISRILTLVEEENASLPLVGDRTIRLGTNHWVAGNPVRFKRGTIELRLDKEWQSRMNKSDRYLVTVLTWPLLMKYGYLK